MIERFFEILTGGHTPEQIEAILAPGRAHSYPTKLDPTPEEIQPWETCMTLNGAWGWVPTDSSWKSPDTLVRTLVETASRQGNFLLGVGPRGDGTFPPEAIERLAAVGAWMDVYGESIWGTGRGPVQGQAPVRSTVKGDTLYLHLFERAARAIEVSGVAAPVRSLRQLGDGEVGFAQQGGVVRITPPAPRAELASVSSVDVLAARLEPLA
jgi:alpha-L-fucosidase